MHFITVTFPSLLLLSIPSLLQRSPRCGGSGCYCHAFVISAGRTTPTKRHQPSEERYFGPSSSLLLSGSHTDEQRTMITTASMEIQCATKKNGIETSNPPPAAAAAAKEEEESEESEANRQYPFRIGYLSDVEGHWEYFLDYIERSNVLDWEEVPNPQSQSTNDNNINSTIKFARLILQPNTTFIYGGDTVDRGPGDIRLVRSLVSLKRRYPNRVHLLVGNRDLNKLRLHSELSDEDMKRDVDVIGKPFWDMKAKSLRDYLEDRLLEKQQNEQIKNGKDDDNVEDDDGVSKNTNGDARRLDEVNTRVERLKYMLKHTLGCPDTFEFRREEIGLLTRIYGMYPPGKETHDVTPFLLEDEKDANGSCLESEDGVANDSSLEVTDKDVVDSFLYEMSPKGSLLQYLHVSSIAAIVGNTIFVHGAIDRLTMKYVPSLTTKFQIPSHPPPQFTSPYESPPIDGKIVESVHEWVNSLNEYLHHGLEDYAQRPGWDTERTSRGGESLLAIQNRPSMWGRSVVCNSYADGGVIATSTAEEGRQRAVHTAQTEMNPLAFEGVASNVMDPLPSQWLAEHGIQRVVVGHKPTGDCPAVLSSKYTGVEIVAVDTSYSHRKDFDDGENENIGLHGNSNILNSGYKKNKFGETRGQAIAMVEITGKDAHNNRLETFGVLACGAEYSNCFPILGCNNASTATTSSKDDDDDREHQGTHDDDDNDEPFGGGDPYLGTKLSDGWWVKASVPPNYHLCRGSGRFVEYDVRPMEDVINVIDNIRLL